MNNKHVYGWYCYSDGKQITFRYPSAKESDLHKDGKSVTVEITNGGGKWEKRRGIVIESNGNYTVKPA